MRANRAKIIARIVALSLNRRGAYRLLTKRDAVPRHQRMGRVWAGRNIEPPRRAYWTPRKKWRDRHRKIRHLIAFVPPRRQVCVGKESYEVSGAGIGRLEQRHT